MKRQNVKTFKAALAKVLACTMVVMSLAVVPTTTAQAAAKPKLSKTSCTITEGKKYDLKVMNRVAGATYVWKTSNKKVATVDKKGVVKANVKGNANITCTMKAGKQIYKLAAKVAVLRLAKKINITNKVSVLNVGQTYDLNTKLVPATSNDKTTWTSSNKAIAAPNKNGKFKALKTGTVTITAKTKSGAKDTCTIKVMDVAGTVKSQAGLDKMLGSGAQFITIKTDAAENFTIAKGNYSNQKLVVDAPNADVHNNGNFASIEIRSIKSNTWYEGANGNKIEVTAASVRVIVNEGASAGFEVKKTGSNFVLVNNGKVTALSVAAAANIVVEGTSKEAVPVEAKVEGIKVTSSVPLALEATEKVSLVLNKGAEGTTVKVEDTNKAPEVSGDVKPVVTVGPLNGNNGSGTTTVTPTPGANQGGASGGAGGSSGGNGGSTGGDTTPDVLKTVTDGGKTVTYTLKVPLKSVKSVTVSYGWSYNVDSSMLNTLTGFLSDLEANRKDTINRWRNTNTTNKVIEPYATLEGTQDSLTKKVTLKSPWEGNVYFITVVDDDNTNTVKVLSQQSGKTTTITMKDDRTLEIKNAPIIPPDFTITY